MLRVTVTLFSRNFEAHTLSASMVLFMAVSDRRPDEASPSPSRTTLEKEAKTAIPALKKVLSDQDEIPPLAAWALYKAGDKAFAEKWMLETITNDPGNKTLANVLDWMGKSSFSILARIPRILLS